MKYLVKFILNIFDYFTEKKIDSVLKKKLGKHLSCLVDVGSHKGEYIKNVYHYIILIKYMDLKQILSLLRFY